MNNSRLLCRVTILSAVIVPALSLSTSAMAEVERLIVTSAMEIGPFRGKEYRYIVGTLRGTAPGGPYAVPVQMAFPVSADDFNGFALVDIANVNTIGGAGWPEGGRVVPLLGAYGDDYLFGNGNVYVTAFWDKTFLDRVGAGLITARGDAYEIFGDLAALARDPAIARLQPEFAAARGADRVIATGYSGSAAAIRAFLSYGLNQAEASLVFDGVVLGVARNANCTNLITTEQLPCDPTKTGGAKVISVMSETDLETAGPWSRAEAENYRQVEVAGVAHVPTGNVDLRQHGAPEQNPVDARPVFRAALHNLQLWLDGTPPPPSIYLDIPVEPTRTVFDAPFWDAARDVDGNVLGGVRLPHLSAALGVYHGFNEAAETGPGRIAGSLKPFSSEEVRSRYPNRDAYVAAVAAAAADLVANRYILQEDADAYVAEAKAALFWN